MTNSDDNSKKTLTLSKTPAADAQALKVRQKLSQGRSKNVEVEVKRRRVIQPGDRRGAPEAMKGLTQEEWDSRLRVVRQAKERAAEDSERHALEAARRIELGQKILEEKAVREGIERGRNLQQAAAEAAAAAAAAPAPAPAAPAAAVTPVVAPVVEEGRKQKPIPDRPAFVDAAPRKQESTESDEAAKAKRLNDERRRGRLRIQDALLVEETDDGGPKRSDAAIRRARLKERAKANQQVEHKKVVREVIIPEAISVQELANRMAARTVDVVKILMKMGVLATPQQMIDADTAELVVTECGHQSKRIAAADVEEGLLGGQDNAQDMVARAPVVTIMGHVDHGKTSLLDALRKTDVVSGEAGGITQHIGAYQVLTPAGARITFIDTPGHAAFTEMRARGAKITDIVVLVVAADDGIKEQTIEAINHIKAANVPMIVAINKIDKPGADIERVKQELLQHEIVTEDFGGEVLCVPVSAKQSLNLDKLEEVIMLQSEMLDLRANPNREAHGVVVESRMEKGRGSVATVLIEKGTLRIGDCFVVGHEWGKVRALMDDHGQALRQATPSVPVEVLGLNGSPVAGDRLSVVANETRAREISEYRQQTAKTLQMAKAKTATMENMFAVNAQGVKELAVVIKADTHGSIEALQSSFKKLETDEVKIRILHTGVSGITESDVILATASAGSIVGFNVRANPQARDLADRKGVPIKYYSIIYDAIDQIKAQMSGLLAPELREKYLGKAEIRQVFNVTKVGKIAGCMVVEGVVQRGARVRLLRDQMVVHEGGLKTLKRMKDDVKEAKEGYECGIAFENYQDIREGDLVECFLIEEIARTLD